jgi:hypothetical protein
VSARVASREFKAEVHAAGVLDLETLGHAVAELKGALDVPGNAKLRINTSERDGGRWSIVALWDPAKDTRPQAAADRGDVHVQPGGIVINPAAGITEEDALKVVQRRIRDNPQA